VATAFSVSPSDEAIAALRDALLVSLLAAREFGDGDRAVVRVTTNDGQVAVSVRDHGAGFTMGDGSAYEARLQSLVPALGAVGGRVELWSEATRGARVRLFVPGASSARESSGDQLLEPIPRVAVRRDPARDDDGVLTDGHVGRRGFGKLVDAVQRHVGALGLRDDAQVRPDRQALQPGSDQWHVALDVGAGPLSHTTRFALPTPDAMGSSAPLSTAERPISGFGSDERQRADAIILSAFLAWRASGLATSLAAVAGGRSRQRMPGLAYAQLVTAVVESVWIARRLRRQAVWSDQVAATADALTASALLLASRVNLSVEDRGTWIDWVPWSFAANAVTGQALGVDQVARGAPYAGLIAAINASASPRAGDRVSNSGAMATFFIGGRLFALEIRRGARLLIEAQRAAVAAGAELAAQQERLVQLRMVHDSVVQVLEAIGSGRYANLDVIRRLAGDEADRASAELEDDSSQRSQLIETRLRELVDSLGTSTLRVELDMTPLQTPLPSEVVSALCAACREALTNVQKHAGVMHADVVLRPRQTGSIVGVSLAVLDRGRGFDPAQHAPGFGIGQSMVRRLEEVRGRTSLESAPGRGTTVTFEWPR
jgi:anti-sigma regulatory factor (Ser/Thr protein kinase)